MKRKQTLDKDENRQNYGIETKNTHRRTQRTNNNCLQQ